MRAENYTDTMNAAQDSPSLWQRSVWPLALFVALPLFVIAVIVEHWLSLEGRLALMVKLGMGGAIGLTVGLILDVVRDRWQRRREAETAAGRLGEGSRPVPAAPPEAAVGR